MLSRGSQLNDTAESTEEMGGSACVGIGWFLESTNINQVPRGCLSRAKSSPPRACPLTTRGYSCRCRHGGGTHSRTHARTHTREEYNGDNYVFRGHGRGGTRGTSQRSVEARAMAIRHPVVERSSLECLALYARWSRASFRTRDSDDSIVRRSGPASGRLPDIRMKRDGLYAAALS